MTLESFRPDPNSDRTRVDYDDYNDDLASEINEQVQNDNWLSNRKQRYYVVKVVNQTLSKLPKSYPPGRISEYRSRAQDELLDEISQINDKQTIQQACQERLFDRYRGQPYEDPPKRNGDKQWHILFDSLIRELHRKRQ